MADKISFLQAQNKNISSTYKQWSKKNKKYQKNMKQVARKGDRQYMQTAEEYARDEQKREEARAKQKLEKQRREQQERQKIREQDAVQAYQESLKEQIPEISRQRAGQQRMAIGNAERNYARKHELWQKDAAQAYQDSLKEQLPEISRQNAGARRMAIEKIGRENQRLQQDAVQQYQAALKEQIPEISQQNAGARRMAIAKTERENKRLQQDAVQQYQAALKDILPENSRQTAGARRMAIEKIGRDNELRKQSQMQEYDQAVKGELADVTRINAGHRRMAINNYLNGLKQAAEAQALTQGQTHEGYEATKELMGGQMSFEKYKELQGKKWEGAKTGQYDAGYDPTFKSREGMEKDIKQFRDMEAQKTEQIGQERAYNATQVQETKPYEAWGGVFDLLENIADRRSSMAFGGGIDTDRQKAAAEMDRRRGTRESRKADVIAKAEDFFVNHYDQDWWEENWANEEYRPQMREQLYDYIMPDTYAEQARRLTPEQKAELDRRIDAMVAAGRETEQRPDYLSEDAAWNAGMQAKAAKQKAEQTEEALQAKITLEHLTNLYGRNVQSSAYNPDYVDVQETTHEAYDENGNPYQYTQRKVNGSELDKVYYFMNGGEETTGENAKLAAKCRLATPDMIEQFTSFYNHDKENGTDLAGSFFKAIDRLYLSNVYAEWQDYSTRKIAETPGLGIAMRAASYPLALVGNVAGTLGTIAGGFGDSSAWDKNSGYFALTKMIRTIRDEGNQDAAEDVARWLCTDADGNLNLESYKTWKNNAIFMLNTLDSVIDNVTAMYTAQGITGSAGSDAGRAIIQLIMSAGATSNTMLKNLESGMRGDEAAFYAIGDGIIEWFTEEVSLEAILTPDVRSMLGDWKKLAAFIGKGAIAEGSEEINADLLNMGADYMLSILYGHEDEITRRTNELVAGGMDPELALKKVWGEKFHEIGMSGLAGAISGGMLTIGRIGANSFSNIAEGRSINQQGNAKMLIDAVNENRPGEMSLQQAEQLQQKLEAGKKLSNRKLGKLSQTVQMEANENIFNPDATDEQVAGSLRTLERLKEARGEKISEEDKAWAGKVWASQADIDNAEGERIADRKAEVITGNKFTRLIGIEDDGKNGIRFRVETDGRDQVVDKVQAVDYGTAAVIREMTTKPGFYSAKFANQLLQANAEGKVKNAGTLLMEADAIRFNAFIGQDMPENMHMPRTLAIELYNSSLAEHAENRKNQVTGTAQKGKVTLFGAQPGTDAWNKQLSKLDKNMRAQVEAVTGVAQRAGIQLDLKDLRSVQKLFKLSDKEARDIYGWQQGNLVGLNLEGEDISTDENGKEQRSRHSLIISFAHEMTHWIQAHSLQGYNALEKYVMDSMIEKGGKMQLRAVLDHYMKNENMSLEDAMSEVVANGCDQILMDKNVQQHIQQTNTGLYNQIKGFVKDLVTKLRNATKSVNKYSFSYESRDMLAYTNELSKRWLGAYDEAITQKIDKMEQEAHPIEYAEQHVRKSFRMQTPVEMRDDDLIAVHNLGAESLMKTLKLGGLAMPSIGVINHNKQWTHFGDISLFFGREFVDPKLKGNNMFTGDAWTPMLRGQNFNTAEEALAYLRTKPIRTIHSNSIAEALTDFRKISDLQEAKKIADKTPGKTESVFKKFNEELKNREHDLWRDILHEAKMQDRYVDKIDIQDNMQIGIMSGVEAIEGTADIKEADKRAIMREAIERTFENNPISDEELQFDFDPANFSDELIDEIIKFSEKTIEEFPPQMMEAKPDTIVNFDQIKAIALPDNIDAEVVDALLKAGVQDGAIHYYEAGNEQSRLDVLKNIPENVEGVRFSKGQINEQYEQAVKNGDTQTQRTLLDEIAKRAGYSTELAYHGTPDFGFTKFDLGRGRNAIFVAYGENAAKHYSLRGEVRNISERALGDLSAMTDSKLLQEAEKWITERRGDAVDRIELTKDGKYRISWYDSDEGRNRTMDWNRRETEQAIRMAAKNAGQMNGSYQLYTRPGNQLVLDAHNNKSTEMHIDGELAEALGKDVANTRMIAKWARENGYDSVRINNVLDAGGTVTDYGIFFNEADVKSADLQTFDDNGELIRPTERFDTEQKDLRWSKRTEDTMEKELRQTWYETRDEMQAMRQQIEEMKPEVNNWTKRMMKAQDEGRFDEMMPEYKEWEEGYTAVRDKLTEAEKKYREAKKALDDYVENRDVAAEREAIEKSGLSEADYRRNQAVNDFGYTSDFREAGYLLPNGRMLNFCGSKGQHYGMRGNDHRQIGQIYASSEMQGSKAMVTFMSDGNIRVMAETPGIDINSETAPTTEQYAAIRNMARRFAGEEYFNVDFTDKNGNVVDSIEYDGRVNADRIVNDIKSFYKTGAAPQQSVVSQFHFSRRMTDGGLDTNKLNEVQTLKDDAGNEIATVLPGGTVAAARFSYRSYIEEDGRGKLMRAMKRLKYTDAEINKYLEDIDSVAALIAQDRDRWDYTPDRSQRFMKKNSDVYKYSLDASTLCAKRLLYQGTLNAIMKELPNTALKPGDLIDLANMMYEMGHQTPCGICYVESRRRNTGNAAQQFLEGYKGDYIPNYQELTTTDGLAKLKQEHEQTYNDFIKAMNKRGAGSVKLVQTRTDYRGEIRRMTKKTVEYLNEIGGLRIQSFSDFETPHMLDLMQAVADMSLKGLKSQAYTKVANFAWVFGGTGIKINLSLMGDVDAKGRLVFDSREGMDINEAMALRAAYSENVGTILVGKNVKHILAAMADPRIDFIIPFHKSGWTQEDFAKMKTLKGYEDFQDWQNERTIEGYTKNGKPIYKNTDSNIDPLSYWNYSLSGKENAQIYLNMCKEQDIVPKFNNFLVDNGDGSWSMQEDGSTDGYWKMLIDFKMYDNQGNGAEQQVVKPNFNMEQAMNVLAKYKGGANTLPIAQDVVKKYVQTYKDAHPEQTRFSRRMTEEGMDVHRFMMGATPSSFTTDDERILWQAYKGLRTSLDLSLHKQDQLKKEIRQIESHKVITDEDFRAIDKLYERLEREQKKMAKIEDDIAAAQNDEGFAAVVYRNQQVFGDFVEGKTADQVQAAVDSMTEELKEADRAIAPQLKALKEMEEESAIKTVKKMMNRGVNNKLIKAMRENYSTAMGSDEMKARMAELVLKNLNGEDIMPDVEALAKDMIDNQVGYGNEEADSRLALYRGMTIEVSPDRMKALKSMNLSLKDLRAMTKGSGISFKQGTADTLQSNQEDMIKADAMLADVIGPNAKDEELTGFANYIKSLLDLRKGPSAEGQIDANELQATILAAVHIAMNEEAGGLAPEAFKEAISRESARINKALSAVEGVAESVKLMRKTGIKAQAWAGTLKGDISSAIDYYNRVAKLAAEQERARVKRTVIDQLKSENTQKLIKQEAAFKERMKNDREARGLAEDNAILRKKIDTVANRIGKRLFAETDVRNIPEEAKPLARRILGMLVQHDSLFRKASFMTKEQLRDATERLGKMEKADGYFDEDTDLEWLVIGPPDSRDASLKERVLQDIAEIGSGLMEYRAAEGEGNTSLKDRKEALEKVQNAVSEIYSMIQARERAFINGKRMNVMDLAEKMDEEMAATAPYRKRTGTGAKARETVTAAVNYGNLTPVYYIRSLKNKVMSTLFSGIEEGENRSGLETNKARERVAQIAKETGYGTWDGQEKHTVQTMHGDVEMTTEQMMALYATWLREKNQLRHEVTSHLLTSGFVLGDPEKTKGKPGWESSRKRPIRMTEGQLDGIGNKLTAQQKAWVDGIVAYMSGDLAELGNEASLETYGIRKFREKYYFPIKSWDGVLNKSSAAGVVNKNENRAMQQSFTKRITKGANNAIQIGDFTPTAMKHIVGMITFNTIGPAVENLNKVLNQQLTYDPNKGKHTALPGEGEEDASYKMNMRAAFREAYGENAYNYMVQFMQDVNGGVANRSEKSIRETLLTVFKKNAVAGSLSVAAQQPLSYIRAAMMISPKYLAQALEPKYWTGSYDEMMAHSGLAVIKEMGKFDMNFGRTQVDWITPEVKEGKLKEAYKWVSDKSTALPQKMDAMMWTRMWTAVKLEQMAQNPDADHSSDAFLDKVADRFNDLMRRTQVYDSVLVKSQNMRSTNYLKKVTTSFMAEPTLTANVLVDAWENRHEKGGKANVAKALATFLLSAAAQAGAKAFFGTGRSPDKNKNREENFLNKFVYNLLNEVDPLNLIPGYSHIIEAIRNGELNDDAMGMLGQVTGILDKIFEMAVGNYGKKGTYRNLEDSIGKAIQIFTNVPLKNAMRDFRAMVNFFSNGAAVDFTGDTYAQRPTSNAVKKYQFIENLMDHSLIGAVNERLIKAGGGFLTTNMAYYDRLYNAKAANQEARAAELEEYLTLGKGVTEKKLNSELTKRMNKDDELSGEDAVEQMLDMGKDVTTIKKWITTRYRDEYVAADVDERRRMMNELTPMYKLMGIDGEEAMKIVTKWVTDAKKKEEKEKKQEPIEDTAYQGDFGLEAEVVDGKLRTNKPDAAGDRLNGKRAEEKNGRLYLYADEGAMDEMVPGSYKYPENKEREDELYRYADGELYGIGTIDLNHRKVVKNRDGSISTEKSITVQFDDEYYLIPTVINGKIVSEDQAIDHFMKTDEYLGVFDNEEEAEEYADILHKRQDWYYNN